MLRRIAGMIRRPSLLPSHYPGLPCFSTDSKPADVCESLETRRHWCYGDGRFPEDRPREILKYKERYKTDAAFRNKLVLNARARSRAWRASLSAEERRECFLKDNFSKWVKRRLAKGNLPDCETWIPEFVDENAVCGCVSCGRVHYKGSPKVWWRSKQDGEYEVSTGEATKHPLKVYRKSSILQLGIL